MTYYKQYPRNTLKSKVMQLRHQHPLARGLQYCWLFNEQAGEFINDVGRARAKGLLALHSWAQPGPWGSGVTFNGSTTQATTTIGNTGDEVGTGGLTIEVALNANAQNGIIVQKAAGETSSQGWTLRIENGSGASGQTVRMNYLSSANNGNIQYRTTNNIIDGRWRHIVATVPHNTAVAGCNIYNNGIAEAITSINDVANAEAISNANQLNIGTASSPATFFTGTIALLRIWYRPLSAAEVRWLYKEPFGMFAQPDYVVQQRKLYGPSSTGSSRTNMLLMFN